MDKLTNAKFLKTLWADFDKVNEATIALNSNVRFLDAKMNKKFGVGVLIKVGKTNYEVRFPDGIVIIPFNMVEEVK